MTVLRPYRLERELDRALKQWLSWLPRWQPVSIPRRSTACEMCPRFVDALDLQELPHGPLHSLFGALEPLLIDQFTRHAAARFPELHGQGRWQVGLHRGVVRVVSPDGHDVDDFIDAQGDLHADEGMISPLEAADARIELIRDYYALFEEAMSRLRSQRQLILRTLDAHVEPKIQAMAEELIAEVTAS